MGNLSKVQAIGHFALCIVAASLLWIARGGFELMGIA